MTLTPQIVQDDLQLTRTEERIYTVDQDGQLWAEEFSEAGDFIGSYRVTITIEETST